MKTPTVLCFLAFLLAAPLLATSVRAQEHSIKRKDVPKVVLDAFQKSYPKAHIKGYAKEVEQKTVLYEVESVEGKVHRDITYLADGILHTIEETLPFSDLPEPVQATVHKEYPKGKVSLCEKVIKGSTIQFELLVGSAGKKYEVVLNADGSIAKVEKK